MLVDTRITLPLVLIAVSCLIFPLFNQVHFNVFGMKDVRLIENLQALLLLSFAVISYFYIKPLQLREGKKEFWLWAVCWWVLLFGRSTSWGRDYFPDVPKIYFRGISIVLIGSVVFPLLNQKLRTEIVNKFKTAIIPVWALVLAVIGLVVSDAIEHHRFIGMLLLTENSNESLLEELYEFPLILSLFAISFSLMKADKRELHH